MMHYSRCLDRIRAGIDMESDWPKKPPKPLKVLSGGPGMRHCSSLSPSPPLVARLNRSCQKDLTKHVVSAEECSKSPGSIQEGTWGPVMTVAALETTDEKRLRGWRWG